MVQRFDLVLHERRHAIVLDALGDGRFVVTVDGVRHEAQALVEQEGTFVIDGRLLDVAFTRAGETLVLDAGDREIEIEVATPEPSHATADSTAPQATTTRIKAPMPGQIVGVQVAVGDMVSKDQPLVVVEAMKMQNELRSQGDGVVTEVHVAAGERVERGAVLLVIAPRTP